MSTERAELERYWSVVLGWRSTVTVNLARGIVEEDGEDDIPIAFAESL